MLRRNEKSLWRQEIRRCVLHLRNACEVLSHLIDEAVTYVEKTGTMVVVHYCLTAAMPPSPQPLHQIDLHSGLH